MTKKILVTGGAGYIGSHTCKLLHKKGYVPVVLDSLVHGHRSFVKWGPFYHGNLHDQSLLQEIFELHQPAAVIHFAAFAYVGESVSHPAKYYENNVGGTLSLLAAMRQQGCKNIVFSSSCAVYGIPTFLPLTEEHRRMPISPYGRSKLMIEEILQDYDKAYNIKSVSLRYFNAAGADAEGFLGEDHSPETHLIPLTISAALGHIDKIEVYGTDYQTADGTAVRDYIHVDDLAAAHILSLEYLDVQGNSNVFNLGTGKGFGVNEIIKIVGKVSGREITVRYGERRAGDPPVLIADAFRANELLGWHASFSDIETIISSAWNWHNKLYDDR
jgi:UDP-glucose-4-epimerase GalE